MFSCALMMMIVMMLRDDGFWRVPANRGDEVSRDFRGGS